MRYSYEFKRKCIEMYHHGLYSETPKGVNQRSFRKQIYLWVKLQESHGSEVLKHNDCQRKWTPEERYELVARVIAGESYSSVSLSAGINLGQLYLWVRKYKAYGYNGLIPKQKGRKPRNPDMKKKVIPNDLTPSEREELIRLRAETEYLKAENEVIKKLIALRHEKWAAQLKAKKQRSLKSSGKKDSN